MGIFSLSLSLSLSLSPSHSLTYTSTRANQNATDELERLEYGLERVKKSLLSKLHDIAREEMFPAAMVDKKEKPLGLIK